MMRPSAAGPRVDQGYIRDFETLREKLAYALIRKYRVDRMAQRCSGDFSDTKDNVFAQLDPVMKRLNFWRPIQTGKFCGLYERDDAAMSCLNMLELADGRSQFFNLGGSDAATLRTILGEIATTTTLEVSVEEWRPRLS